MRRPPARSRRVAALLVAIAAIWAAPAAAQSPYTVVEWGADDLSQKAIQYRDDHDISARRNVAVFEFEYPNGKRGTIAVDSERYTKKSTRGKKIQGHSERRAAAILRSYGIKEEWVRRIYTELEPCQLRGRMCDTLLRTTFKHAQVSYSFGYREDTKESGRTALRKSVTAYYKQRNAARDAMRVPGAKPPAGPLTDALARPGQRPGGIDFSTLELRYVSDAGPKGGGISYSLRGVPSAAPSDPNAGLAAARRSSDAFFAWLALPPSSFWVNLKPHEPDKIIDPQFARTDAGHVLLDADFKLKRVLWPLTHPATPSGAELWRRIDALYGGDPFKANICTTFRMWIEAAPATVRESADELHILDAPLAVKMEAIAPPPGEVTNCPVEHPSLPAAKLAILQQVVLPGIVRAVNTAPEFAELRRVYLSRVAAEWVRARAGRRTPLGRLVNSGKIDRWVADPAWNPMDIFNQYVTSYRNPDYTYTRTVQRDGATYTLTYVMGGVDFSRTPRQNVSKRDFRARWPGRAQQARRSLKAPSTAAPGEVWLGAGRRKAAQPRIRLERGPRRAGRGRR